MESPLEQFGIIDYTNIDQETIEKYVEFINWALVPDDLFEYNKNKFGFLPGLTNKVLIEKHIEKVYKLTFPRFPHVVYFFENIHWSMQFNLKTKVFSVNNYFFVSIRGFYEEQTQKMLRVYMMRLLKKNNIDTEVNFVRLGYNSINPKDKDLQNPPPDIPLF